ncbi:MAG: hypothetical protein GY904_21725 [Planctomycetaceae bacterium]|nr:hypothetical protein [Planctomycetaceae bacterium]
MERADHSYSTSYESLVVLLISRSEITTHQSTGQMMIGFNTYLITWTTYGTWVPGDQRGWRKGHLGNQPPQPRLEAWCRKEMNEPAVLLNSRQRHAVESVCKKHANVRSWGLHAICARSNHVHVAITTNANPQKVRDQLKANATRALRELPDPIQNKKVWTRRGDVEAIRDEESLERVIIYIQEAQDRMDRRD